MNRLTSLHPVKQRWALLESNLPRDSWIEGRRNKTVSTFGEAQASPKAKLETFISEPEHALENSSKPVSKSSNDFPDGHQQQKPLEKTTLTGTRFFEASPYALESRLPNRPRLT
jgi:hypothetical protein